MAPVDTTTCGRTRSSTHRIVSSIHTAFSFCVRLASATVKKREPGTSLA